MVTALTAISTGVDDRAESVSQPLLQRDSLDHQEQVAQQPCVVGLQFRQRGDLFLGDDEDVNRGLRIRIGKCQ